MPCPAPSSLQVVLEHQVEVLKALLDASNPRVDLRALDVAANTPLHLAVRCCLSDKVSVCGGWGRGGGGACTTRPPIHLGPHAAGRLGSGEAAVDLPPPAVLPHSLPPPQGRMLQASQEAVKLLVAADSEAVGVANGESKTPKVGAQLGSVKVRVSWGQGQLGSVGVS